MQRSPAVYVCRARTRDILDMVSVIHRRQLRLLRSSTLWTRVVGTGLHVRRGSDVTEIVKRQTGSANGLSPRRPFWATQRPGRAEAMAAMASSFCARTEAHWRRNWNGKCHGSRLLTNTMLWSRLRDVTPVRVPEDVVCRSCLLEGDECSSADQTSYVPVITTRTTLPFNPRCNSKIVYNALAIGDDHWEINWRNYDDGHRFLISKSSVRARWFGTCRLSWIGKITLLCTLVCVAALRRTRPRDPR